MNSTDALPTEVLSIPTWGMDWATYEITCRYLALTPRRALYERIGHYLLRASAQQEPQEGFWGWLAELRPGGITLGALDVWTRLLKPRHPWRFRMNAVVAIHECDPRGYRELMKRREGMVPAWLFLFSCALAWVSRLFFGAPLMSWVLIIYILKRKSITREREHFANTTVLVTGASRGLGLALTGRLLFLGARVLAVARNQERLASLARAAEEAGLGERLVTAAADVSVPGAIEQALANSGLECSSVDTVIVNAGAKEESSAYDASGSVQRVFDVNCFGALRTASPFLRDWRERGHIIFISSLGRWHGMARSGAYNASKAALSILAESMAVDLATDPRSIRVSAVEPGLIHTAMTQTGALQRLLAIDTETAAKCVLQGAAAGRTVCRFPWSFALTTAVIASLPSTLRIRLLSRLGSKK